MNNPKVAKRSIGQDTSSMIAGMADLVRLYVGPSSLLLATDESLVCLLFSGVAYSYDYSINRYRWTLQRPKLEERQSFLEKLKGLKRGIGDSFGFGVAYNAVPEADKRLKRHGLWFPNLLDLHAGVSIPSSGIIVDVVSGLCDEPVMWPDPPSSANAEV